MSKELLQLMHQIRVKKFAKSAPKKLLLEILHEIEVKKHYGRMRNWDLMVEMLARYLVHNEDLTLANMGYIRAFEGLRTEKDELYKHIGSLDLLQHYVTAAKAKPWDYIGEVYGDMGLVGPGQNMTPRGVVDMMIKMTYPEKVTQVTTQLDPCVGSGRFLFEASVLMPDAPLILFGIEINLSLYRACLVNMAMFSKHPFSIICADTLQLDPKITGPASKIWDLGNRWDPPDVSAFYWKPPPINPEHFSLKAFTEKDK